MLCHAYLLWKSENNLITITEIHYIYRGACNVIIIIYCLYMTAHYIIYSYVIHYTHIK